MYRGYTLLAIKDRTGQWRATPERTKIMEKEKIGKVEKSTEEKVIDALEQMKAAYYAICELAYEKKINQAFNDSPAQKIYSDVFAGSFDEIPLAEWCEEMEDFLKN